MNVRIEGQVDQKLYVRAIKLARPELRIVAVLVVVVVGLLLLLVADDGPPPPSVVGLLILVALTGVVLGFVAPVLIARQALRTGTSIRAPFSGEATADGLSLESEYGSMNLPWSAFHRSVVSDDAIVVFQASNLMNMIDRSFVDGPSQWEALSQLVADNVPAQRRSKLITVIVALVALLTVLTLVLVSLT